MDDLELQISQIQERVPYGNCGFAFTQVFSSEALAHAYERFPEVKTWWDTRINSDDRWSYGYLERKWTLIRARLDCLAAERAVESVVG